MILNSPYVSGSLTVTGNITALGGISISGSIASASYASNAELLDGLDSSVFVLSSSFQNYSSSNDGKVAALNTFSASILSYTSSTDDRIAQLNRETASLNLATASLNNATASLYAATSSIYNFTSSANLRIGSLEQYTQSLNTRSASFACVTATNNFGCAQYFSNASNAISFSSTGSLYSDGGMRITKDMYVSGTAYFNNVTVFGTQSINYITSSQLNIASNLITVNTSTPAVRFGGLAVYDSGSLGTGLTGSLLWDSENNKWIYSNPSGSTYDGGMLISGPRNSSGLGNEQGTTACALMMGQGGDHITSSAIFHYGNATCFYGNKYIDSSGNSCQAGTICTPALVVNKSNPVLYINAGNNEVSTIGFTQGAVAGYGGFIKTSTGLGDRYMSFGLSAAGTNNDATEVVKMDDSGVTCFLGGVCAPLATIGGQVSVNAGNGNQLYLNNTGQRYTQITFDNNTSGATKGGLWWDNTTCFFEMYSSLNGGLRFYTGGDLAAAKVTLTSTGIACFACQVCAPSSIIKGTINEQLVLDFVAGAGSYTHQSFRLCGTNQYRLIGNTNGNFVLRNDIISSDVLTFACAGAVTFACKIGIAGASATYPLTVYNGSNGTTAAFGGTTYGIRIDNDGTFSCGRSTIYGVDASFYGSYQPLAIGASNLFFSISGTDRFNIGTTGIACFSSTVCAPTLVACNGTIFLQRGANTCNGLIIGEQGGTISADKAVVIRTAGGTSHHLFLTPGIDANTNACGYIRLGGDRNSCVGINMAPTYALDICGYAGGVGTMRIYSCFDGGGIGMIHLTSNGTEGGGMTFEKTSGTAQKFKFGNQGCYMFLYNETAGFQPLIIAKTGEACFACTVCANRLVAANSTVSGTTIESVQSSNADGCAVVQARWDGGVGMRMYYHPNSAVGVIENTYQITSGQVFGDILFRHNSGGTQVTRLRLQADGGIACFGGTVCAPNFVTSANSNLSQTSLRLRSANNNKYLDINSYNTCNVINSNYADSDVPIILGTFFGHQVNQLFLATNCNVGIGTGSPLAKLHIDGNGFFRNTGTAGYTAYIGSIAPGNTGDRYLHVQLNTIGSMMYWIKLFGYVYTTNVIEGLGGGYVGGGTGGVNQAFQNGAIVAQYQNSGYVEIVVDTVNTSTTNRWGSITFLGGTDNITTIQPLEIRAYSWTSTTTRVY